MEGTSGRRRWANVGLCVLAAVALVGVVVLLYAAAVHVRTPNSDAASLVLEGQSVHGGQLLLHGWALSLDSFWTTEVPIYTIGYLVAGTDPVLMSLVPAVLGALVVLLGAMIARAGRPGAAGAVGAIMVAALLALPTHALAFVFLLGGSHLGAMACSLLAFWALRRGGWGVGVVVAVAALAAGMLGDLQTFAYGTVPVLLAGIVAMARCRAVRDGVPAVATAVGACTLAAAVRLAAGAIGTFTIGSPAPRPNGHQMVRNARHLYRFGRELLGLGSTVLGRGTVPRGWQDIHAIGAVVVVVAVAVAVVRLGAGVVIGQPAPGADGRWWRSEPSQWRHDDLLTVACFCSAASFVALAANDGRAYVRYLTATAVFMIVLGARVAARAWSEIGRPELRRAVAVAGVAVMACFAVGFAFSVSGPRPRPPEPALATWLEQHHLTNGVGSYWVASITTVQSHGRVKIRPVIGAPGGRLVRFDRESDGAWYDGQAFQFLVFAPSAPWGAIDAQTATATFGLPTSGYIVEGYYAVLVWQHPFTVASTGGYGS